MQELRLELFLEKWGPQAQVMSCLRKIPNSLKGGSPISFLANPAKSRNFTLLIKVKIAGIISLAAFQAELWQLGKNSAVQQPAAFKTALAILSAFPGDLEIELLPQVPEAGWPELL